MKNITKKIIKKFSLIFLFYFFLHNSVLKAEIFNEIIITGNKRLSVETIIMFSGLEKKTDIDSKELNSVDSYYVPHRSDEYGNKGWSSCCLHGLGIELTEVAGQYGFQDELNAPYDWTALTNNAPMATKFWKQFPAEKYSRVRFMKLEAHGQIEWHDDHPKHELPEDLCDYLIPINVALVNPALCYMEVKDHGLVPWRNGKVYLINILKKHRVQNNSNSSRIHMIAQAHIGNKRNEFNELLDRSLKKNGIRI